MTLISLSEWNRFKNTKTLKDFVKLKPCLSIYAFSGQEVNTTPRLVRNGGFFFYLIY